MGTRDSFVNDIYTSEGKQEEKKVEKSADSSEGQQDEGNMKEDQEEAQVEKGIYKLKKDLDQDLSEEQEKLNVEPEKEKEQEDNREDSQEKAADSFVNDVSEAEGRQEPTVESKQEEKQEENPSEPADEVDEDVKPGVLTVHLIEASNLLNKDIMGKSDPYVEILFEETKVKSNTVNNSLSPQWNFISNFDVSGDDTSNIKFSVFDADYGKDQLLGSCSISIKDALSEMDSARWISLEGPESGKISIKFGFTEKPDENEEAVENTKRAQDTEERVEDTEEPMSAPQPDDKTEEVQSS